MSKYNPTIPGRLAARFVKEPSRLVNSVWTRTPTKDEGPFIVTQADRQNVTFLAYNTAKVTIVPFQVLLSAIVSPIRYTLVSQDLSWATPGNYVTYKRGSTQRRYLYKVVAWSSTSLELLRLTPGSNTDLVHRYAYYRSLRNLKPATEKQISFACRLEEFMQRAINLAYLRILRNFNVPGHMGRIEIEDDVADEFVQARPIPTQVVQPEQGNNEGLPKVLTVLDRILADGSNVPLETAKS
jgi:hypothetical protein